MCWFLDKIGNVNILKLLIDTIEFVMRIKTMKNKSILSYFVFY